MIHDTCSPERYYPLNISYFKKADAILLVYDISNKKTFDKIKNYYIPEIKDNYKNNIPIVLLGNMTDKEDIRQILTEQGSERAQ